MPDLQDINITPHTLMTTHEIVRDLADFKFQVSSLFYLYSTFKNSKHG